MEVIVKYIVVNQAEMLLPEWRDADTVISYIHCEARIISTPDSKVTVVVFPTDEEYMIAKDTYDIVKSL